MGKWDETCYKCHYNAYHETGFGNYICCDLAYSEDCDLKVRKYLVGESPTYKPKFMFRIPNIADKYQKCKYFFLEESKSEPNSKIKIKSPGMG